MKEKSGEVICPNCKNIITGNQVLRCPRCFSPLVKIGCQGNCSKCNVKSSGCS